MSKWLTTIAVPPSLQEIPEVFSPTMWSVEHGKSNFSRPLLRRDVREWLQQRGHSGTLYFSSLQQDHYHRRASVLFGSQQQDLAVLFKLTWLGE